MIPNLCLVYGMFFSFIVNNVMMTDWLLYNISSNTLQ